jgi:endonuclease IV
VEKMAETIKELGESIALLVEKLAGKGSNLELSFKGLTLEIAGLKTKINGSVVLDVLYVSKEK